MGYSHYWEQRSAFSAEAWSRLTTITRHIARIAEEDGVRLVTTYCDKDNAPTHEPATVTEEEIFFNGHPEQGDAEDLCISREVGRNWFCKTYQRPYDVAVVAVLATAQAIAGDAFDFTSDGDTADLHPGFCLAAQACIAADEQELARLLAHRAIRHRDDWDTIPPYGWESTELPAPPSIDSDTPPCSRPEARMVQP